MRSGECNNIFSSGPIVFCSRCRKVLGYIVDWAGEDMDDHSILHLQEVRLLTFRPLKVHSDGDRQVYFLGAFSKPFDNAHASKKIDTLMKPMPLVQLNDVTIMRVAPSYEYETLNVPFDEQPILVDEEEEADEEWLEYLDRTILSEEEDWMDSDQSEGDYWLDSDWSEYFPTYGVGLGSFNYSRELRSDGEEVDSNSLDYFTEKSLSPFSCGSLSLSSDVSIDSLLLERSDVFMHTPPIPTRRHSAWNLEELVGPVHVDSFLDDMALMPCFQTLEWFEYRGTVYNARLIF